MQQVVHLEQEFEGQLPLSHVEHKLSRMAEALGQEAQADQGGGAQAPAIVQGNKEVHRFLHKERDTLKIPLFSWRVLQRTTLLSMALSSSLRSCISSEVRRILLRLLTRTRRNFLSSINISSSANIRRTCLAGTMSHTSLEAEKQEGSKKKGIAGRETFPLRMDE